MRNRGRRPNGRASSAPVCGRGTGAPAHGLRGPLTTGAASSVPGRRVRSARWAARPCLRRLRQPVSRTQHRRPVRWGTRGPSGLRGPRIPEDPSSGPGCPLRVPPRAPPRVAYRRSLATGPAVPRRPPTPRRRSRPPPLRTRGRPPGSPPHRRPARLPAPIVGRPPKRGPSPARARPHPRPRPRPFPVRARLPPPPARVRPHPAPPPARVRPHPRPRPPPVRAPLPPAPPPVRARRSPRPPSVRARPPPPPFPVRARLPPVPVRLPPLRVRPLPLRVRPSGAPCHGRAVRRKPLRTVPAPSCRRGPMVRPAP